MTADYPRISTREVCELARYSRGTLRRRIAAGHMPAPIDQGGCGLLFDRWAVVRALGLDHLPPIQWATAPRNTRDGQNLSAFERARRQRALDQLPPMSERRRAELHAWLEDLKAERLAKKRR
jgi:predicted DNA-binding transcriptional regulator AlpA